MQKRQKLSTLEANQTGEYQADFLFDELVEIADDCRNDWMERNDPTNPGYIANRELVARTKLRLDTRKWCASKLKPKKYGERMDVSVQGEMVLATLTLEQLEDRLARLQQATVSPAIAADLSERHNYFLNSIGAWNVTLSWLR